MLSDNKMKLNIEKLDGQLLQVQLKLLLTVYYVHGKQLNLKSNYLDQAQNIQLNYHKLWLKWKLNKEQVECIKVLVHYGVDKFHILLLSSLLSNGSYHSSMIVFSLKVNKTIQNQLNYQLLLLLVILLVFSVLLYHILLILWFLNCTVKVKEKDQLDLRLLKSIQKLDSKDYGLVLLQESSWSVP